MKTPAFFQRSELAASLWNFRREFWVVGLCSFVANLLMLAPTLYMMQVYDRVLASRNELTLLAISLITLFFFVLMAIAEWSRSQILIHAGIRFDERLSSRVFNSSFETYLEGSSSGPTRAFTDLLQIRQMLTGQTLFTLFDVPWTPIYIAVMYLVHPLLGWVAIVFAIIQGLVAWFGHARTVKPTQDAAQAATGVQMYLKSKLRNIEVIESMGMLGALRKRWQAWQDEFNVKHGHASAVNHRATALSKFARYVQQSVGLAAGALLVANGELSPGGMIACNLLMNRALSPIDSLVQSWRSFANARDAFLRLETLLTGYPEREVPLRGEAPTGEVVLRGAVADAPGRKEPILKGVDLSVRPGEVVVVMGPSGSGKSTLARVITGIWPHVTGEVQLGGVPLAQWNRVELGPHIGYLPQDIELFEGSIAENISRMGELDSEKVIEAARIAGLHEMILRFPQGYDTPVGAAGRMLSGGQRQRIGLARAVYGNPSLVVLDEPNANLDEAGEGALARAVQQLKAAGKAVILITHRPSAIALADRIVLVQDGTIRADGPRDAVLASLRPAQAPARLANPQPA
ncbi:type I secretion system permease/ATPase [Ramlibacter sp. PS4R-6]|uniref:type I secretion system permease/ATPase n=1 Tax=Ramlibacter sp. PS4R-6 TaxID=3133438 RepID=UPI0030A22A86